MITTLAVAAILIAHGAIHSAFLAPRPPATASGPAWPFEMDHSWLFDRFGVRPTAVRALGRFLVTMTIGTFSFAALVSLGVAPAELWAAAVAIGASASLGVLAMYFRPLLALGAAIDLVLLWYVVLVGWRPAGLT